MFTITFKKQDRDRIKGVFGASFANNGPAALDYSKDFSVDLLERAARLGLVFYGREKGRFGDWGFVCNGKSYALAEITDGLPDHEDNETRIYLKMLEAVKTQLQ